MKSILITGGTGLIGTKLYKFLREKHFNVIVLTRNELLSTENKDFVFCVELPILASKSKLSISTSKSNERARFGGKKKVNAFLDGLSILKGLFKLYFK